MEIIFDKINIDSLIQIGLITVFIVQTGYLIRQTNFGRRSSQANLVEVWKNEFKGLDRSLLVPDNENLLPDEKEFQKLVDIFDRMHYRFREKLLKPSDFADAFIILYWMVEQEKFRKTNTFKENYLRLQTIFSDFERDIDTIVYLFNLGGTSDYIKIFQEIPLLKKHPNLNARMLKDWKNTQQGMRVAMWFIHKVKRKTFFKLKPPV